MRINVVTLFPELIAGWVQSGILKRARDSGIIAITCLSPREYATDIHRSVDDAPYGGGGGMVMMPGPIAQAMDEIDKSGESRQRAHRILLTPQGVPLNQTKVAELAKLPVITLVCGRYQGVDERVRRLVDEEISIGDFVVNGGEIAAISVIEAVSRLIPGVLGNQDSCCGESHTDGLLEYPQYTRPQRFRGMDVPSILLSGNHEQISKWRRIQALKRTRERRPDLFERYRQTEEESRWLRESERDEEK
ncbi:MAG: tRNA (guanosine(37)-N1)-methyltransferase TrmD [Deltaproteobacteria bacterium]|nr:tRNA (guanosine(37)-N1)-methyltransferase TrmD [Deltaproteobacteria bacterium]